MATGNDSLKALEK